MMKTSTENDVAFIVLARKNPNGKHIDGPELEISPNLPIDKAMRAAPTLTSNKDASL